MRPPRCALRFALLISLLLASCDGGGGGLEIRNEPIAPNCTPAAGQFPSGLAMLSAGAGRATVVQFNPPGVAVYGLDAERPAPLAARNIGTDSDGDGVDDESASEILFPSPINGVVPVPGEIQVLRDDLSLVSTSDY